MFLTKSGNPLEIPRRAGQCIRCETRFCPDQPYFSAIIEEDGDFRREDYCAGCWSVGYAGDGLVLKGKGRFASPAKLGGYTGFAASNCDSFAVNAPRGIT